MKSLFTLFLLLYFTVYSWSQALEIKLREINPQGWPFVWTITFDQDSTIWAGDSNGGLFYKTTSSDKFVAFNTPSIGSNEIRAISAVSPSDIWMSVDEVGIFHYNGTTWKKFDLTTGLPSIEDWRYIDRDQNGNIWFGNYGAGVARYDGTTWKFYNKNNSGLGSNFVSDLKVNVDGKIWVGGSEILSILDGNTWTTTNLDSKFGFKTWIKSFYLDKMNRMWVTTQSGLLLFENGVLTSKKSEFGSKDFEAMVIDNKGVIWVSETFEGIWRFDHGQQRLFNTDDDPKVPTQAWGMLVSSDNVKLMIGNRGANLIEVNDDEFPSFNQEVLAHSKMKLFPNPTVKIVTIESEKPIESYTLFDADGKLLENRSNPEKGNKLDIDLQKFLNQNLLLINVNTVDGKIISEKILIAK